MFRARLNDLDFVTVHDLGADRCGIVTFSIQGKDSAEVQRDLAGEGINVTHSLPEGTRLDMSERKLPHLVRASVHYYNTEEEIERFCDALVSRHVESGTTGQVRSDG